MLSTVIIPHSLVTSVRRPLASLAVWALLGAQLLVSPMGEAPEKPWPVQSRNHRLVRSVGGSSDQAQAGRRLRQPRGVADAPRARQRAQSRPAPPRVPCIVDRECSGCPPFVRRSRPYHRRRPIGHSPRPKAPPGRPRRPRPWPGATGSRPHCAVSVHRWPPGPVLASMRAPAVRPRLQGVTRRTARLRPWRSPPARWRLRRCHRTRAPVPSGARPANGCPSRGPGTVSVEVETWVPFRQLDEPVLRVQRKTPPLFPKLVQLTKVSPWPSDTAANPPPENLACWANWTRTTLGP